MADRDALLRPRRARSRLISLRDSMTPTVGALLRRQPLSPAKVDFAWRAAVGDAMSRASHATLGDDGRLDVVVWDERWRAEIRRTKPMIRPRLETLLGPDVIQAFDVRAPRRDERAPWRSE